GRAYTGRAAARGHADIDHRSAADGNRTHHQAARREGQAVGDRPRTGWNVAGRVRRLHQGGCRQVEESDRGREDPADRRITDPPGTWRRRPLGNAIKAATSKSNHAARVSYPAMRGAGSTFHFRASPSASSSPARSKGFCSTTKPCCTASRALSL